MLSYEQIELIKKELDKDSRSEFVEQVILRYIKDEDDMYFILNLIPSVANKMLEIRRNEINHYRSATDALVAHVHINRSRKNPKMNIPDFSVMFNVCRACFPDGVCYEGDSIAMKEFFKQFIEILKRKDGFDYDSLGGWRWANDLCRAGEWLTSVIHLNINPEWICPDDC